MRCLLAAEGRPILGVLDYDRLSSISGGDRGAELELVALLISETTQLVMTLAVHARENDREAVRAAAHAIKGSAANVGAPTLQEIGTELDAFAADPQCDLNAIDAYIARLQSAVAAIAAIHDGWTAELGQ